MFTVFCRAYSCIKRLRSLELAFVLLVIPFSASFAATINQISQYGITWTFDKDYEYGQFANGDYWVVGPVMITVIDPGPMHDYQYGKNACTNSDLSNCTEFSGYSCLCVNNKCEYVRTRNGFDINPTPAGHPYDDRAAGYKKGLISSLPLTVNPNSSLVSTISNPDATNCTNGWLSYDGQCRGAKLKTAAVLTVVATPPSEGSFRPAYAGTWKTFYLSSSLRRELLLHLGPVTNTPDINTVSRRFERVWLDHIVGWSGQYIHPIDNLDGYGADIATNSGVGGLRLLLNDSLQDKEKLLVNFVQVGIDLYGILKSGGSWPADGGHASGRKFPIVFAGFMLNDQEMLHVNDFYFTAKTWQGYIFHEPFQEDCQTYYDDDETYPFFKGTKGMPLWGIRHCQDPDAKQPGYHDETSGYRLCCNSESWIGQTLAMRLLKLESAWGHQAYFDYEDRYAKTEFNGYHGSGFSHAMWVAYRPLVDTCNNSVQDRCSILCNPQTAVIDGEKGLDCGGTCVSCQVLLYGDISMDGEITAYDAALTARAAAGLDTLTAEQIKAADVSGDREVTAYDAALIAQKAVGLIDKFPAEI